MKTVWSGRCRIWAALSAFLGAWLIHKAAILSNDLWTCIITGLVASLCLVSAVLAFHMSIIACSDSHTIASILRVYFRVQILDNLRTPFLLSKLARMWKYPRSAQQNLLLEFTARDAQTEYGRRYRLADIWSLGDLQTKHPLTFYEHYKKYVERLADGEQGVFIGEKVVRYGVTSGTTGVGKWIPQPASRPGIKALRTVFNESFLAANRVFGKPSPLQKYGILYSTPMIGQTKSGHTVTSILYVSPEDQDMFDIVNTPPAGFHISSDFEATYIQLLFALRDKHLGVFLAFFTSILFKSMKLLEDNWETMLDDITKGRVYPKLAISDEIRHSLNAAFAPHPGRADELRAEFSKGSVGLVTRIWPHLKYIFAIDNAGFQDKLNQTYTKGTPVFAGLYISTETCIAINFSPEENPPKYVLNLSDNIFEFIPEDNCQDENPRAVLLDEVDIGQNYELVLTTRGGLYRYRNGDVVEVVGSHGKCPVIQFKYRTGELLNLRSEKVSSVSVLTAINELMSHLQGATLVDWTTAESPVLTDDEEGGSYEMYYIVFLELQNMSETSTDTWAEKFDDILCKHHYDYKRFRNAGTIAMPRVHPVKTGSFTKLKEFILAHSTASVNQFKTPRKLRKREILNLMMSCVS